MTGPRATPAVPAGIELLIGGDVTGSLVAIGNNITQVNTLHGDIVLEGPPPVPRLRGPFRPKLPRQPEVVGRQVEIKALQAALSSGGPVLLHGEEGIGKTTLLRHVLSPRSGAELPARVAHVPNGVKPVSELLQVLFHAFYDCDIPYAPGEGQLRRYLEDAEGLVLVDHLELKPVDLDRLLTDVPGCEFLLAATEHRVLRPGRALSVPGLVEADGLALLEQVMGPLAGADRQAAIELCRAVDGHPGRLVQAAVLARDEERPLSVVLSALGPSPSSEAIIAELVASLSGPQRQVLAVLAMTRGAPVHLDDLAAIVGLPDPAAVVEPLRERRLAMAHSPRYSLAVPLEPSTLGVDDRAVAESLVEHYASREEPSRPGAAEEDADAVLAAVGLARRLGGRQAQVVRLVRSVSDQLARGGRLRSRADALRVGVTAAREQGDQASQAWFLHQLGVQSLCLENLDAARRYLRQALALRRLIGDTDGAEVTQYHLDRLGPPPPPPPRPPEGPPRPPPPPWKGGPTRPLPPPRPPPAPVRARWGLPVVVMAAVLLLGLGGLVTAVALQPRSSGTDASSPLVQVVEPDRLNFGLAPVGSTSPPRTVVLTRKAGSDGPATLPRAVLAGPDPGEYDVVADNCSRSALAPGGSCSIGLSFSPTGTGGRRAQLRLGDRGIVALEGVGTASALQAEPSLVDFGEVAVGVTSPVRVVTVTNQGAARARLAEPTVSGSGAAFAIAGGTCRGAALDPGRSCSVEMTFTPRAAGRRAASVTLAHDGPGQQVSIALQGSGQQAGSGAVLVPDGVEFPSQRVGTRSAPRVVEVTNRGSSSLVVESVRVGGPAPRDFVADEGCDSRTLGGGRSCRTEVVFAPTVAGERTATLEAVLRDGPPAVIALSGTGKVGSLSAEPSRLDFGPQLVGVAGKPQTVTVTNSGEATVDLSDVTVSGPGADFGAVSTECEGRSLEQGDSCRIQVSFKPSAAGPRTGTVTVAYDGGASLAVALSGSGTLPTISIGNAVVREGDTQVSPGTATTATTVRAQTAATFTVSLSARSARDVTVEVATADAAPGGPFGRATANEDYVPLVARVVVKAGQLTATVTVTVLGDSDFERDEQFAVVLSSPAGATLAPRQATGLGTIENDDSRPIE